MRLSSTSFVEASQCLKKYEYHKVLQLVPNPENMAKVLRRGIWIHSALESYHKGVSIQKALEPQIEWALAHGVPEEDVREICLEVVRIMKGYIAFWQDEPWEFVCAERQVEVSGGAHTIFGTVDLIVKTRHGKFIVEHKSTSHIPDASWRAVDPQTALQYFACRQSDDPTINDVDGILFNYLDTNEPSPPKFKQEDFAPYANTAVTTSAAWEAGINTPVTKKVKSKGVTTEVDMGSPVSRAVHDPEYADRLEGWRQQYVADGKFYQRYPIYRPDEAVRETLLDVKGTMYNIVKAEELGHYPRSLHVVNCSRWCQYGPLCVTEYLTGKEAEIVRREEYVIETPEIRAAGRVDE